jgi:hypothetical protein
LTVSLKWVDFDFGCAYKLINQKQL